MQEILERIMLKMKDQKISARKLCEKLGIEDTNFIAWKKGKTGYMKRLSEIAKILNCSVEYLTTGIESEGDKFIQAYNKTDARTKKAIDVLLGFDEVN